MSFIARSTSVRGGGGYDWGWYFMDSDYYYAHEKVMVDSGTAALDDRERLELSVDTSQYLESPDNDYTFTIAASKMTDLSRRVVTTSSVVGGPCGPLFADRQARSMGLLAR